MKLPMLGSLGKKTPSKDAGGFDAIKNPFVNKVKDEYVKVRSTAAKKVVSSARKAQVEDRDSVVVAVEIETGGQIFYRAGLEDRSCKRIEIADVEPKDLVITAFTSDWRNATEKQITTQKAAALIGREQEISEPIAAINYSRSGAVYGTIKSRLLETEFEQAPALFLLDRLMEAKKPEPPFVAGFVLGELDLLVLYAYGLSGVSGGKDLQVSISPYDATSIAETFAAEKHLPHDTQLLIFNHDDVAELIRKTEVKVYPRHAMVMGLKLDQFLMRASLAAWGAALAAGAWAGSQYIHLQYLEKKIAQTKTETNSVEQQTGLVLSKHTKALSIKTSANYSHALELAGAVLPLRGKVNIMLEPGQGSYDALIPINQMTYQNVLKIPSLAETTHNLSMKVPEGCTISSTGINGGINDIQRTYICSTPAWGARNNW